MRSVSKSAQLSDREIGFSAWLPTTTTLNGAREAASDSFSQSICTRPSIVLSGPAGQDSGLR